MMEHISQEEQLISILLTNKKLVEEWAGGTLFTERFDSVHHDILSGIMYAHQKGVKLTRDSYKAFLATYKNASPAIQAAETSLFDRCLMRAAKTDDFPMLLERVQQAFIRRKTSQSLQEYSKEREKRGDLAANRSLVDKLTALEIDVEEAKVVFETASEHREDFLGNLKYRRENPNIRLTCGIKEIDSTMNVGFKDGHLTVFCAPIGGGKTTIMCNVAANLFSKFNTNVLYVPLEMPRDEIFTKLIAREHHLNLFNIEHPDILDPLTYENMVKTLSDGFDKWNNLDHKFSVMDMPERAKVSTIKREIEKRISYFKPKVIFIDYVDNLIPDYRRKSTTDEMNDMLQDLRKMGASLGFHICTAAQVAREFIKSWNETKKDKQQSADSTSIRGGLVYAMNADSMYAQMPDPEQPKSQLIFMCIKSRHGSPLFTNNSSKTHLRFIPEMALIQSPDETHVFKQDIQKDIKNTENAARLAMMATPTENIDSESPF